MGILFEQMADWEIVISENRLREMLLEQMEIWDRRTNREKSIDNIKEMQRLLGEAPTK